MEWICRECASYNDGSDQRCAVCGASRPAEIRCVCPECKSSQGAFPGMRCEKCDHVFTEEDFPAARKDRNEDRAERLGHEPGTPPQTVPETAVHNPPTFLIPPAAPPKKTKKPRTAVIIAVTAIIVVGALAALFIVLYFRQDKPPQNSTQDTTTQIVFAEPKTESYSFTDIIEVEPSIIAMTTAAPSASATTTIPVVTTTRAAEVTTRRATATTSAPVISPPVTSARTTAPPAVSSYDLYEATIRNYGRAKAESRVNLGYSYSIPTYGYAIKDINSDGTDELVIQEKAVLPDGTGMLYVLGAIYTLDNGVPVELYFVSRHGSCYVTSDGYIVFSYKGAIIQKIVGAGLITVAEYNIHDGTFDGEEEDFLRANGVSTAEMTFDFIPFNG